MKSSTLFLILIVFNISSTASEATQQTRQVSFWKYLKYVDPFYYLKKAQLAMIEHKIKTKVQENIASLKQDIALFHYDLQMLEQKKLAQLLEHESPFKTSMIQYSFRANKEEFSANSAAFLSWKEIAIRDLKNSISALEKNIYSPNNNAIYDWIVKELEMKRDMLQQEIESYE